VVLKEYSGMMLDKIYQIGYNYLESKINEFEVIFRRCLHGKRKE
jgi:hypothetical protein